MLLAVDGFSYINIFIFNGGFWSLGLLADDCFAADDRGVYVYARVLRPSLISGCFVYFSHLTLSLTLQPLLHDQIPGRLLLLVKLELLLFLLDGVVLLSHLILHLSFQFLEMIELLHVVSVLLSKLLVNGCLAVFNNDHLSQELVFLLYKLLLLLLAMLLLYILKI